MKELITRVYVMLDEREMMLEYYLISENEGHTCEYGIAIKKKHCEFPDNDKAMVGKDRAAVLELIEKYAKNFVFPASLQDLIMDYCTEAGGHKAASK